MACDAPAVTLPYVPTGHCTNAAAAAQYPPWEHIASGGAGCVLPGGQWYPAVHALHDVAPAYEYRPAPHICGGVSTCGQKYPAGQVLQDVEPDWEVEPAVHGDGVAAGSAHELPAGQSRHTSVPSGE